MKYPISKREQEVLHLIAYENSTKMIAQELYISEHTVVTHRKNLLAKLEAKNVAGLVRKGFEMGFLQVAVCLALLSIVNVTSAQTNNFQLPTSINDSGSEPDSSAVLDVSSTSLGMLIPRMTVAQRNLIQDPATSLLVYQTDIEPGFYFNAGTPESPNWQSLTQIAADASKLIDEDEDTGIELIENSNDQIIAMVDDDTTMIASASLWLTNTPNEVQSTSSETNPALLIHNEQDNFSHIGFKNSGFTDNRFFISADPSTTGGSPADMRFYWNNVNSGNTINFFRMVSSGSPIIEFKQDAIAEMDLTVTGKLQIGDDGDITDVGAKVLQLGADWVPSSHDLFDLGSVTLSWEDLFVDDVQGLKSLNFENGYSFTTVGPSIGVSQGILPNVNNQYELGSTAQRWATLFATTANISAVNDLGSGDITVDAHCEPSVDCTYNLGSSSRYWNILYAKETVTGKLTVTPTETPPDDSECTADNEGEIVIVKSSTGQNEGSQAIMVVCIDGSWIQI